MILGQLTMGARQPKNAPLNDGDSSGDNGDKAHHSKDRAKVLPQLVVLLVLVLKGHDPHIER